MDFIDFSGEKINIGVVGVGLIGGSICKSLIRDENFNVFGIDINCNVLEKAELDGAIHKGYINPEEILPFLDVVFICLYEKGIYEFIGDHSKDFKDGVILTDTFGLKNDLTKNIKKILPKQAIYIGGHPMAGKESFGYEMSDSTIFENSNYIITTDLKDDDTNLIKLILCINKLGNINIIKADPSEHDQIIALTSHLPHIIATSLVRISKDFKNTKKFMGGSFKDSSRIADINEELWSSLLLSNKIEVINQIENLESNLSDIKKALVNDKIDLIKSILIDGRESLEILKK